MTTRSILSLAACLAVLVTGCSGTDPASNAVQTRFDNLMKAYDAKMDLSGYASAEGVGLWSGYLTQAEIKDQTRVLYANCPDAKVTFTESKLTVVEDQASFSLKGSVTYTARGQLVTYTGSAVLSWKLEDDVWKVNGVTFSAD